MKAIVIALLVAKRYKEKLRNEAKEKERAHNMLIPIYLY